MKLILGHIGRFSLYFLLLLLIVGAVYQFLALKRDQKRFPPPGQMVDVGGYRLHLNIMGEATGKPTVILDAGMVSFSSNWAWVQPKIAEVTRVVSYDRAGLGWSEPGPKPRDAGQSARELHMALQTVGINPPYVLAGHSYGGLVTQAFAVLYPNEVVGMVLVDASNPDQWAVMGFPSKNVSIGQKLYSFLARFGTWRGFNKEFKLLAGGLPQQQYDELMAFSSTPLAFSSSSNALKVWDEVSRPLINQAGDLGDLPLIVLSVTEQPLMGEKLTRLQTDLLDLSSNSKQIIVHGATHEGLVSQPENAKYVEDAILEILDDVSPGNESP